MNAFNFRGVAVLSFNCLGLEKFPLWKWAYRIICNGMDVYPLIDKC